MHMSILLLALALATPGDHDSHEGGWRDEPRCTLQVHALDQLGQPRSARRVSAAAVPAIVFRARVEPSVEPSPPLLFDVYSPRGLRYQVLLGTPRLRVIERDGERVERPTRTREAALAVAGSSIELTSMYGRWRVESRLEGESQACGRPEYFTIRP
jgi:hypothetical protein